MSIFLKIWFYIRFPSKIPQNIKNDAMRPQKWENRAPGWAKVRPRAPKVSQRAPKVSQKGAKGSQKWPKGSQKAAKGTQKGAKGEPKGDQNASKSRPSEKVAKMMEKRSPHKDEMGGFWERFSIKNRWKNRCRNWDRKSKEILRKTMRKQTYILMIFGIAFHEKSSFSKKVHVRKPYDSCSRIGVREGSPKKKEIKKIGKHIKKIFKNRSRKRMQKWRNNLQKVIKKGGKNEEKNMKKSIQKKWSKNGGPGLGAEACLWCHGTYKSTR